MAVTTGLMLVGSRDVGHDVSMVPPIRLWVEGSMTITYAICVTTL